ncbi:dihydropteroate synthase [Immundisolibacter cernigliae]|uniref:dihydropteroate synthase n=1 Tax=Immundisolibacter cernigliae TaxID=1810504 RepID=A0A1B1YRD0_9GAMM|nr:dihydropteroate synthase [Immundisolibacter cernigliae]ANX03319.1 dihydropteroate synthase [Immundisolibacter cernigliae]
MLLDCAGKPLDLSRSAVMGVLNLTRDSFSGDGLGSNVQAACARAIALQAAGAAVIDIGGESTRPGAARVSVDEELQRVLPVIECLAPQLRVPISIDTRHAQVMRAAVAAGAGLINDVAALREPGALQAAADLGVPVVLMHMQGEPGTMQQAPRYVDVVAEVAEFLEARVAACERAGIARRQLLLDPGFGFGKTTEHNLALLRGLPRLAQAGLPVVAGLSRKSLIGALTGAAVTNRLGGSIALALLAAQRGARLLRVHDVEHTVQALAMLEAVQGGDHG